MTGDVRVMFNLIIGAICWFHVATIQEDRKSKLATELVGIVMLTSAFIVNIFC